MSSDGKTPKNGSSVEFLPASRSLQKKSGGPSGQFGKLKVEAAQNKVNERADVFMDQIKSDLKSLRVAYDAVLQNPGDNNHALASIAVTAREIKGIAGTFGFDLLTQIGDSLYEFAADIDSLTDKRIKLIGSHIDAMELIIERRITGDGGPEARELLAAMGIATEKFS